MGSRRENGKETSQKSKGYKRGKHWHRGNGEDFRWQKSMETFPDLNTGADPASGTPTPLRRGPGPTNRGETA